MAWTDAQRSQMLYRVVNLSRFLIRPGVRCKNLASYLLGRVLRRLQADFQARYAYVPYLVETFVGPDQEGTCFKAANFLYLGTTQGRGRPAPVNACTRSKKKVYVYALARDWRAAGRTACGASSPAGGGRRAGRRALGRAGVWRCAAGRPAAERASGEERDLTGANHGQSHNRSTAVGAGGHTGIYRFIEKADELGITPRKILAPHRQRHVPIVLSRGTLILAVKGNFQACSGQSREARARTQHRSMEWLEALPAWDGKERLDTWLVDLCGAQDNPATRWAGAYMFGGPITRAYQPGFKFDVMPVLIGPQGCGKSSLVRACLPPVLQAETLVMRSNWMRPDRNRWKPRLDASMSRCRKWRGTRARTLTG